MTTDLEQLLHLLSDNAHFYPHSHSHDRADGVDGVGKQGEQEGTRKSGKGKGNGNGNGNGMVRCTKARAMFAMRACRKSVMIGKSLTKPQMTVVSDE